VPLVFETKQNFQIFKMGGKGLGRAEMKLGRPRGNCQVEGERKKTIKKKRGPAAGPCMHGPTWPHGHAASRRTSTSWRPEASSSSSERTEKKGRGGWELTGGERWSSATAGQGGDEVGLPRDGSATFPSPAAAPPDGSVLAAVSERQQLWRHAPAVLGR
jgi:hypothetical protein